MKKMIELAGIAVAAAMIFSLTACANGTTSNDDDQQQAGYLISGKFASQTGTGDAVFYADYVSNARSVARAVGGLSSTEKELTGKIEDGDIVFNLKGVYDTATEKFFLSAGSSVLIYQLAGTLSSTGAMSNSSAAVKVKDGNNWVVHEVAVATTEGAEISGSASATQEDGIPSSWYGLWESDEDMQGIFTAYQLIDPEYPDEPAGLLDTVTIIPGEKYETVWQAYAYYLGENGEVLSKERTHMKLVIEASGSNLKWTLYPKSMNVTFAPAKAYNINDADPNDPESVQPVIVHRPGSGN